MAAIAELDPVEHEKFMRQLPTDALRELVTRWPPNLLYRHKRTGQRVVIRSYAGDGTVRMVVSGLYNLVLHERVVFGVDPHDLEECELPTEGEELGAVLSADEVELAIAGVPLGRERLDAIQAAGRAKIERGEPFAVRP